MDFDSREYNTRLIAASVPKIICMWLCSEEEEGKCVKRNRAVAINAFMVILLPGFFSVIGRHFRWACSKLNHWRHACRPRFIERIRFVCSILLLALI